MTNPEAEFQIIVGEDRVRVDEPLAKHLNFRIGGPAKWFVEVRTIEELEKCVAMLAEHNLPYFILGGGSNTLVSDEGFHGAVLKLAMRRHTIDGTTVTADAGVISASLARVTANAGLEGFAWAISLPGTIGGAVRGNAGCFGGEMKDVVTSAKVLRDGEVIDVSTADLKFGYRDSAIKHSGDIVLQATFELKAGDADALKKQLAGTLAKRKETQPLHAGSAGCMFKNVEVDGALKSAGKIIDEAGLKGTRIGDASISEEHGNFIINHGKATAADVKAIIDLVKRAVKQKFDIEMHEEVQLIGF